MHNAEFTRLGLNWAYVPLPVETAHLGAALRGLATAGFVGFNVTIPHKQAVIPYLDDLTVQARQIGAVNTIRWAQGRLEGYNTDCYGFDYTLREFLGQDDIPPALVLGTGGASKAVVYVLEQELEIREYYVVSRNPVGARQLSYGELDVMDLGQFPLIINTTPIGMYPDVDAAPIFPYDRIGPEHFVYDLIYNPAETVFLARCKAQGARTLNGMPMLVGQAEKAWEIWNKV